MSRDLRPHQTAIIERLRMAIAVAGSEVTVAGHMFRPVVGHGRYWVSDAGVVFSTIRAGRFLRPTISPQGYPYVSLMGSAGRPVKALVHRIVAEAFVANPAGLAFVNHRNGIKTDPRVANLEWVTAGQNNDHARATRLSLAFGETHYAAKLSDLAVLEIRRLGASGLLHREIAAQFGVRRQHITKIIAGQARLGVAR